VKGRTDEGAKRPAIHVSSQRGARGAVFRDIVSKVHIYQFMEAENYSH